MVWTTNTMPLLNATECELFRSERLTMSQYVELRDIYGPALVASTCLLRLVYYKKHYRKDIL